MQKDQENHSKGLLAEATGMNLSRKIQVNSREGQVDVTGLTELSSQFQHGLSLYNQFAGEGENISNFECNIKNNSFSRIFDKNFRSFRART